MAFISDIFQRKRLDKEGINIRTQYIVGHEILERNTDGSRNDEIASGIRCRKDYFVRGRNVHSETFFDSRIEYSFVAGEDKDKQHKCPNCGMSASVEEFTDGCPYCGSYYNIDYSIKDLGSKYAYDLVLRDPTYKIVTGIVDIIVSMLLSFAYIRLSSRTFNSYDIAKGIGFGLLLSLALYYIFYTLDAYAILGPVRRYKEAQNRKQMEFWKRTGLDKAVFFNNLNYEVRKNYYTGTDVIDYDVLDFTDLSEFVKDDHLCVRVKADVRVVRYKNGTVSSQYVKDTYTMKKVCDAPLVLHDGTNVMNCHNCGAPIDVTKGRCEYCGSEITYFQQWIMD